MGTINIGKKDIIWAYAGSFFKVATNIILLPIILRFLSDDELGLWYVFASIGQLAVLLDFGFAATLSRNIAYVWVGARSLQKQSVTKIENNNVDPEFFKLVLETCRLIYLAIAIVALLALLTVGYNYICRLSIDSSAHISYIIYSIGVFLNLLYSYYTSFLRGVGAVAENNIAGVVSKAAQILISIVLLLMGYGLLGVSIAYLASGFLLRIISRVLFYKYQNVKSLIKSARVTNKFQREWDLFKVIWHNASKDGLVTMSNYLSTQANTLICSGVLGLTTTGSYGLSVQIATMVGTVAGIPFTSFLPKMQEYSAKQNTIESKKVLSGSIVLYIIAFFLLTISVFILMPVLKWLKPNLELEWCIFMVVMLYFFIHHLYHMAASFISTTNQLPYTCAFVISSVISVCLSFILAKYFDFGLWALVVAPIIVVCSYNAWKWPLVVMQILSSDLKNFILEGIRESKSLIMKLLKIS